MENINSILASVDVHHNMLIIGSASSNYMLNRITYFNSTQSVLEYYGDSNLYQAFKLAKDIGASNIFLMNIKNPNDYLDIAQTLRQYDFTYIVLTDILFSDHFYDAAHNYRKVTYCQYLLEQMAAFNDSIILATDKHASLYEDVDAFLDDMKSMVDEFKDSTSAAVNGENLCFIGNNLSSHKMANVAIAAVLCLTSIDLNEYPTFDFGSAIFDIDKFDLGNYEIAYFKNNYLTNTTIENFVNLHHSVCPEKIVEVDRIVKFIKREMDFSEFQGKTFSSYIKLQIEKKLRAYLDYWKGYIIDDYTLKSVGIYKESPGAISILNTFDIWPVNCTEKVSVVKGV